MDKREYQEKLQEINRLIAAEDYEGAARVADSIDWKRVRNVQTLVMISEVYEALERYEDSKVLLLRAYRRSPVGRTVLYRLVECCIRLRQFDQAIEYYSEYVQAAPHDNNKYILKYKIYRGRGSSLDEQIEILQDYLEQEYNEKWAYELARLQVQADRVQEGLATCDDLVLWFHSGKYVIKALELKKKYAPLTPKQQEIYDNRFNEEDEEPELHPESYLSEAASLAKAERAAAAQEEIKSELAADISQTAQIEATKVELSRKAEEAQARIDQKAEQSRRALDEKIREPGENAPAAEIEEAAAEVPAGEADETVAEASFSAAPEAPASIAAGEAAVAEEAVPAEAVASIEEAPAPAEAVAPAEEVPFSAAPEEPAAAAETAAETLFSEPAETAVESSPGSFGEPAETSAEAPASIAAGEAAVAEAAASIEEASAPVEAAAPAEEAPAPAEEAAPMEEASLQEEPDREVSPEQMQEDMVRSMREIVSGVGPQGHLSEEEAVLEEAIEQSKEDQENAVAARGTDMTFRVPESEASQKRQAGRLTIDDILLSMGDRGDHVRMVTGGSVMSASEEAQMTAQQQAEAKAASYDFRQPAQEPSAEGTRTFRPAGDEDPQIPRFLREDIREARQTEEIPSEEIAEADDSLRAKMGLESRDRAAGASDAADEMEEAAAAADLMNRTRVPYTKEIAEAKTRRLPVEEIRRLHEVYMNENAAEQAAINAAKTAEKAAEMAQAEAEADRAYPGDEDVRIAEAPGAVPETAEGGQANVGQLHDVQAGDGQISGGQISGGQFHAGQAGDGQISGGQTGIGQTAAGQTGGADEGAAGAPWEADGASAPGGESAPAQNVPIGEQVTIEVPKSEPEPQLITGRPQLKENQLDLFRGFTSIGSLPEQIAGAIWQAEHRRDDRTSKTGNILILGAHGCGKTTIATGIAKAIAEDKGTHSVKMARIYAADLNRKDIAATIAKIAGGVLIVEEAGDLDDAIVDQLTTAMEFRTDGLIMILEDEQRYIHELLMRHPRFTMKFTAQIYIPEYTEDDLVNFGRIYAESKDYVLSDSAADACRDRITAARKGGEAVSVTNVIELTDRAIKSANTFLRRIGSSKKRYDDQDRVILREKDFR